LQIFLQRGYHSILGTDLSQEALDLAKERGVPDRNLAQLNIRTDPLPGRFDVIWASDILLYMTPEEREAVMDKITLALNEHGQLVVRWASGPDDLVNKEDRWLYRASETFLRGLMARHGLTTKTMKMIDEPIYDGKAHCKYWYVVAEKRPVVIGMRGFGNFGVNLLDALLLVIEGLPVRVLALASDPAKVLATLQKRGRSTAQLDLRQVPTVNLDTNAKLYYEVCDEAFRDAAGVIFALPARYHGTVVEWALNAGLNVYTEKPFVLDAEKARWLIELARMQNRLLMVGHNLLYAPMYQRLKEIVADPAFGPVRRIEGTFLMKVPAEKKDKTANVLEDVATHHLYLADDLLGAGAASTLAGQVGWRDDRETVDLHGRMGTVEVDLSASRVFEGKAVRTFRVIGDRYAVTFDHTRDPNQLIVEAVGGDPDPETLARLQKAAEFETEPERALVPEMRDFVRSILAGTPVLSHGEAAVPIVEAIERLQKPAIPSTGTMYWLLDLVNLPLKPFGRHISDETWQRKVAWAAEIVPAAWLGIKLAQHYAPKLTGHPADLAAIAVGVAMAFVGLHLLDWLVKIAEAVLAAGQPQHSWRQLAGNFGMSIAVAALPTAAAVFLHWPVLILAPLVGVLWLGWHLAVNNRQTLGTLLTFFLVKNGNSKKLSNVPEVVSAPRILSPDIVLPEQEYSRVEAPLWLLSELNVYQSGQPAEETIERLRRCVLARGPRLTGDLIRILQAASSEQLVEAINYARNSSRTRPVVIGVASMSQAVQTINPNALLCRALFQTSQESTLVHRYHQARKDRMAGLTRREFGALSAAGMRRLENLSNRPKVVFTEPQRIRVLSEYGRSQLKLYRRRHGDREPDFMADDRDTRGLIIDEMLGRAGYGSDYMDGAWEWEMEHPVMMGWASETVHHMRQRIIEALFRARVLPAPYLEGEGPEPIPGGGYRWRYGQNPADVPLGTLYDKDLWAAVRHVQGFIQSLIRMGGAQIHALDLPSASVES